MIALGCKSLVWLLLGKKPTHCLFLFVSPENFSLIWKRHHCRWGARHLWPLSSEDPLTCHTYCDPILYYDLLRGPVTLTPIAERLAEGLSSPVLASWVWSDRGSNPDLPHARRTLYLYATAVFPVYSKFNPHSISHWSPPPSLLPFIQNLLST